MRLRIFLILLLGLSSQKVCWTLVTARVSVQLLLVVILCIVQDFEGLNSVGNFIVWVPFFFGNTLWTFVPRPNPLFVNQNGVLYCVPTSGPCRLKVVGLWIRKKISRIAQGYLRRFI